MPPKRKAKKNPLAAYNRVHRKDVAKRGREDKKALSYLKPKRGRGGRK